MVCFIQITYCFLDEYSQDRGVYMLLIRRYGLVSIAFLVMLTAAFSSDNSDGVWVRTRVVYPTLTSYKVRVVVVPNYSRNFTLYAGQTVSETAVSQYTYFPAEEVLKKLASQVNPCGRQGTCWINLSPYMPSEGLATVKFFFEPKDAFKGNGVKAQFLVATGASDLHIIRKITESDTENVISLRLPRDLKKGKKWILTIREDVKRRLAEIGSFKLPAGPLPEKIWCMTGFRPWGTYTDPAITDLEFQAIRKLGMNGYWDMNAESRDMAAKHGIDRTTFYWRSIAAPPGFLSEKGIPLDWNSLSRFVEDAYRRDIEATRKLFQGPLPEAIVDMSDEPAGLTFAGEDYKKEFRSYLKSNLLNPEFFGKKTWEEIEPIKMDPKRYFWWDFFETRDKMDMKDINSRRLFYWSTNFWCHANAMLFSLANSAVEKYAPEISGTRANLGPPWWYDYGTVPRGIDGFELGRLRGVTLAFNEDWIGDGDPRWPLEINTFLTDWNRAYVHNPDARVGSYITRDANRASVKLRVFGCLARNSKIFDFYYYGPSYGHFDHWSDNSSMVRGVAELTRDIGAVDDILWEGKPPRAEVALFFSRSWPVWKTDDTEQVELMMTYLALLHSHIPVDIISDIEVADGILTARNYKCLYVVNESIPDSAAREIERWVKNGGRLWVAGWAGIKDQYNTPTDVWNEMLGTRMRSWSPVGDLTGYGKTIEYADYRRKIFDRICISERPTDCLILEYENGPAGSAYRRKFGNGLLQVVPWTAGKEYLDGHRKIDGALMKGAIIYPDDVRRQVIAGFAQESVALPATTDKNQVLAWPIIARNGAAILIANYTGNPAGKVNLEFSVPWDVKRIHSLRHGNVIFSRAGDRYRCALVVDDVTDILVVEPVGGGQKR